MVKARVVLITTAALLAVGVGAARAEDSTTTEPVATVSREMPPAPLRPWRVSGHLVGDSYAHVTDVAGAPTYRLGDRVYQAWHRLLGRDKMRLKVRLTMDPPPAPRASTETDPPVAAE